MDLNDLFGRYADVFTDIAPRLGLDPDELREVCRREFENDSSYLCAKNERSIREVDLEKAVLSAGVWHLLSLHQGVIKEQAEHWGLDPESIKDDCYRKLINGGIDTYDAKKSFACWLRSVACNAGRDQIRQERHAPRAMRKPSLVWCPALGDVGEIPTDRKGSVILAIVNGVLHFRLVTFDGTLAVDTDETRLGQQADRVGKLMTRLESWGRGHEPNEAETREVIESAQLAVQHLCPPRDFWDPVGDVVPGEPTSTARPEMPLELEEKQERIAAALEAALEKASGRFGKEAVEAFRLYFYFYFYGDLNGEKLTQEEVAARLGESTSWACNKIKIVSKFLKRELGNSLAEWEDQP